MQVQDMIHKEYVIYSSTCKNSSNINSYYIAIPQKDYDGYSLCVGLPDKHVDFALKDSILEEFNDNLEKIDSEKIIYALPVVPRGLVINEDNQIYLEGANKAFELPEFKSLEVARNFINLIDAKEIVVDLLNTGFAKDINVYIGDENDNEQLKDFSIVTFKHKYKDRDLGTIGIIGPKRMDYSKVISVMKYISKKLNGE